MSGLLLRDIIDNSYKSQKQFKNSLEKTKHKYDDELSSMNSKVFVAPDGTPNIAHRGTKTLQDVLDDGLLAVGLQKYSKRFNDARELTKKVENKYGKPAIQIGHSLGGSLAEYAASKNAPVKTYNKGVGLGGIGRTIPKNQTDIRTKADLISVLSTTQKHKGKYVNIDTKNKLNPLDAHNTKHLKDNNMRFI